MNILITGGTGFLGQELARSLDEIGHSITIFSRNEFKQFLMKKKFKNFSYILGDIRSEKDCLFATRNIDIVIHAAALKRIDACESNQSLAIDTNINGSLNIIRAAEENGAYKCILISTDKAYSPNTTYGGTKYVAENLFINWPGSVNGVVVRYGNVLNSTGSVLDAWENQFRELGEILIRDKEMTRFFWSVESASKFVIESMNSIGNTKMFIPKIESLNIFEMGKYLYPSAKIVVSKGSHKEKIHEEMFHGYCSSKNVVSPENHSDLADVIKKINKKGFRYPINSASYRLSSKRNDKSIYGGI